MEILIWIGIILIFIILPIVLTAYNLYFTAWRYDTLPLGKRIGRTVSYLVTMIFGVICNGIWEGLSVGISDKEWYEPLLRGEESYHYWISADYGDWFGWLLTLSGFSVLFMSVQLMYKRRLPPLAGSLLIGLAATGDILAIVYCIQLLNNISLSVSLLFLLPLNYMMITGRIIADEIHSVIGFFDDDGTVPERGLNGFIYRLLSGRMGRLSFVLVSVLPVGALLVIILILTGQGADAVTKAFTMTADWTFSTQQPPPPEYYDGHYLCTVAAGGHRRLVRPTRMGVRGGERIVVNRQLCIANAFEDLIMERTPRFHRAVRGFYDKHGYPISRHITTPLRADIVYILMKPLEWLFLLTLYLFDTKPESRIAVQYTGKKHR